MLHGYILLAAGVEVLGGHVPELVERWKMQRELARHGPLASDAPAFEPFSEVLTLFLSFSLLLSQ